MRRMTVNEEPVLVLDSNSKRTGWSITVPPVSIESANTGIIQMGIGFQPVADLTSPQAGTKINAGSSTSDDKAYEGDTSVTKGQIWARATVAGMIIEVDEESEQ
jgi:hypothetical protein